MSTTPLTFTSDDFLDHYRAIMRAVAKIASLSLRDSYSLANTELVCHAHPVEYEEALQQFELVQAFLIREHSRVLEAVTESSNRWLTERVDKWESGDETEVES